ncbi:hypothetical protein NKG94_28935 [Micromonospora sp. M12]
MLAGTTAPPVVDLSAATFEHANRDVGALALGAVETSGPSRLTGDDDPRPIDDSRPYGKPGGLRPPLALHQVDVERQMPRSSTAPSPVPPTPTGRLVPAPERRRSRGRRHPRHQLPGLHAVAVRDLGARAATGVGAADLRRLPGR